VAALTLALSQVCGVDEEDEENEFHTIGIGDRQPKAYENLSCNDRMLLGVLKV